jgi:BlaI family transcriptional regulator, penicillinase repressor
MFKPTDAELAILQILWEKGQASVKEVHEILNESRNASKAYTTTLKTLQIMTEKGMVLRDPSGRKHIYRAAIEKKDTQKQLIRDLLISAFRGSTSALVMQALGSADASDEELDQIKALIEQMKNEK